MKSKAARAASSRGLWLLLAPGVATPSHSWRGGRQRPPGVLLAWREAPARATPLVQMAPRPIRPRKMRPVRYACYG
jgi:hypothetical protein